MKQKPSYNLEDFLDACRNHQEKVIISRKSQEDAKNELNLSTSADIKNYLLEFKSDSFVFVNTLPFRNNPNHPMVDAYHITLPLRMTLYLAFYISYNDGVWFIKSFHRDDGETNCIADFFQQEVE